MLSDEHRPSSKSSCANLLTLANLRTLSNLLTNLLANLLTNQTSATNVPWQIDSAIRRRFEKRVYIPLPDEKPRTVMVRLNLGDTPHNLTDADFERLGKLTKGASGSDIKVLVKEASMEPIKRCQQAKQFVKDAAGNYFPCAKYPNCSLCEPKLSTDPPNKDYTCRNCGALRMTLWDIPNDECPKLQCPHITVKDFETVLRHAFSTVSDEELKRYDEWTEQFGQDGSARD